jgi:hypothetical protein
VTTQELPFSPQFRAAMRLAAIGHVYRGHSLNVSAQGCVGLVNRQISFRWMAFITASRRLWVRNFWLM